jgi:hypothetical protein
MYAEGPDAPGDYINACAWFLPGDDQLARHTSPQSTIRLRSCFLYLTTAQLAKARRLAVNWRPDRQKKAAAVRSPENVLVEGQAYNEGLVCPSSSFPFRLGDGRCSQRCDASQPLMKSGRAEVHLAAQFQISQVFISSPCIVSRSCERLKSWLFR